MKLNSLARQLSVNEYYTNDITRENKINAKKVSIKKIIQKNWRKFKVRKISNTYDIYRSLNPVKNSILTNLNKNEDVKNLMEMISSSMKLFNKIKTENSEGNIFLAYFFKFF